jgi:hypothetical protein
MHCQSDYVWKDIRRVRGLTAAAASAYEGRLEASVDRSYTIFDDPSSA